MKTRMLLIVIILGIAGMISCKKDSGSDPNSEAVPKIKTRTSGDSTYQFTVAYAYDASGRLVSGTFSGITTLTVQYGTNKVEINYYSQPSTLAAKDLYTLNSSGLAVSNTYIVLTKDKNNPKLFKPEGVNADTTITTYEYDNNGYLVRSTQTDKYGTSTTTYVILNGNTVSYTWTQDIYSETVSYSFLTDKNNTIGSHNAGIMFLGKQNRNLVQSIIGLLSYTYEFDSKGRVSRQSDSDGSFSAFTYTD